MPLSQEAESLKAEGNVLYGKGSHKPAIEKYTAAINIASDNAVLFANRAASHLGLKQYEQARQDAKKATELDPDYAKGWGRLGSALEGLSKYREAIVAYGRAIECIDATSPISDADKRLKAQYKSRHTYMELLAETRHFTINESEVKDMKMPWELAKDMIQDLAPESSGHVIIVAAETFAAAKKTLKGLVVYPNGLMGGPTGGISDLSNAIMTDERCIIMKGDGSLFEDTNKYLRFEASQTNGWVTVKNPEEVLTLAKERLYQSRGDWDSVRGALACQARAWIILGHLGQLTDWSREELFLWYDRACKLIELGRAEWPNVSRDDRGTIFDETFLRGVQVLRMNEYMQAFGVQHLRTQGRFTLDGLLALADEILDQIESTPPEAVQSMRSAPPYFYLSFYLYPKASAWSMRGFVYYRKASFASERTADEDCEWARKAGDAYVKSADLYPEDDEVHCQMLQAALECYTEANLQAREMLPIMERIRLAYPKMMRIWKNSPMGMQGRHKEFVQIMEAEDEFKKAMDDGRLTLDGYISIKPNYVSHT